MRCASPPDERRRGAVEREITEPDFLEELEATADLGEDVARDLALATDELQALEEAACVGDRQRHELGDRAFAEAHCERSGIEPLSGAVRAGLGLALEPVVPDRLLAALLRVEATDREPGAEAGRAPAVLAVVGEQPRVGLGLALAASGAGATRRVDGGLARRRARARRPCHSRALAAAPRAAHVSLRADTVTSATGSSIVCSLNRASRGHGSVGTRLPSTRSSAWPLPLAQRASSV